VCVCTALREDLQEAYDMLDQDYENIRSWGTQQAQEVSEVMQELEQVSITSLLAVLVQMQPVTPTWLVL